MSEQGFSSLSTAIQVDGVGCVALDLHPDRVLTHWVLGIVVRGQVALAIGSLSSQVLPGSYYLLPPGIRHFGMNRADFEVQFWHFRSEDQPAPCFRLPWFGAVPAGLDTTQLLNVAERMHHRNDDHRWISAVFAGLLSQLCAHQRLYHVGNGAKIADDILGWLLDHRDQPWDRLALERRFGYSYRYLNRLFHAQFGQGIRDRHVDLRIDLAAAQIAAGMELKNAALSSGFTDYFNFLRRFRQRRNVTAGSIMRSQRHQTKPT